MTYLIDMEWFMQVPTKISLVPFDSSARILAQGPLYEKTMQTIVLPEFLGMEPIYLIASEMQLHLFIITIFIAFIAPFGGFLFSGLKRALRQSQLGITMFKGGVIDRLDCIIITGCFMLVYITMLVYKYQSGADPTSHVLDMVSNLSEAAQKELYHRLKADLLAMN